MPHTKLHQKKKLKNWLLFALILGMMALFFAITIIRVSPQ